VRGAQVVVQGAVPAAQFAAMAVPAGQPAVPMAMATPAGAPGPAYGQAAPVPVAVAVATPYNPNAAASSSLYPAVPVATAVAYPAK
jgi:hypothetical protein